jgi:ADP-ribosyl-[dinitrogen reductase] hydrolase
LFFVLFHPLPSVKQQQQQQRVHDKDNKRGDYHRSFVRNRALKNIHKVLEEGRTMTPTPTTGRRPLLDKARIAASLRGMLVGDALAMPGHWFYSPTKLRKDYYYAGEEIMITEMVAPKAAHAESMVQGMSYSGSLDIMHDKAHFYEGNTLAEQAHKKEENKLSVEEIEANRDDHGNYVGHKADERVHYHATLQKGQNTANMCLARLTMRYLGQANANKEDHYHPDEFLEQFKAYMLHKPDPENDKEQLLNHNDTYLDVYLRGFFTKASNGTPLRECALSQRDTWSIGSLDGVAMAM